MRKFNLLCLTVLFSLCLVSASSPALHASEGFDDIAKLAKSGVGEGVLVAFVQSSPLAYDLTVDEILYLNDLGVTAPTITAVVDHGKDIRAGKAPIAAVQDDVETLNRPLDSVQTASNDLWSTNDPAAADPLAAGNNDPTIMASPLYEQPEMIQERQIVRETVYEPTVVTAPAAGECTLSHFYETLTPYGTWVNINDSWCWQPSVAVTDDSWRPYMQRGHWVLTDSGWCWESDYSWGWAPFHYGRWAHVAGYGWMWTPDTVWGPAWVSFRESNAHFGWAPLPPAARFDVGLGLHFGGRHGGIDVNFGLTYRDYCFVPQDRFCDSGLAIYAVPPQQQVVIFNQTTVIQNNVTYVDNRVIVNGPRRDRVEAATHRQLRELRLTDANIAPGQALTNTTHEDRNRGTLQMYRPAVQNIATVTPAVIAARQLAVQERRDNRVEKRTSAEQAASAKAAELRERHLATVDAHKEAAQTHQQALFEQTAEKRSEAAQVKLNRELQGEQNAQRRAELAANLKAEQLRAEDARKQRAQLEKQAVEQKKMANELALERDRAARQAATQDNSRIAVENKARLAADRQAREQAQRDAGLAAEKATAERRAQLAAQKAAGNNVPVMENDNRARIEAARAAREAQQKAAADALARQRAQLEAERQARLKGRSENVQPVQPVQPLAGNNEAERAARAQLLAQERAARDAQLKAAHDAAQAKAQQDAQLKANERAQGDAARAAQAEAHKTANAQLLAQEKAAQEAALAKAQQDAQLRAQERAQAEAARSAQLEANKAANAQKAAQAAAQAEAARLARQQAAQAAATERAVLQANREIKKGIVPPANPRTGQPYTPEELNAIKGGR